MVISGLNNWEQISWLFFTTTKVYLFGDKLTERVAIHSPLCVLGTGTESSSQEARACFSPAFITHETTSKVSQYLKGYWLKEFPQQLIPDVAKLILKNSYHTHLWAYSESHRFSCWLTRKCFIRKQYTQPRWLLRRTRTRKHTQMAQCFQLSCIWLCVGVEPATGYV